MTKKTPSIEEAKSLLRRAVEANQDELVADLRKVRSQLSELISAIGSNSLPREVQKELDALARMRNEVAHGRSSTYVRVSDKVEWIRDQLTQHGGECPKAKLMEAARREWSGRNISQAFLDKAIDEAFGTRKESDATVTVLAKAK